MSETLLITKLVPPALQPTLVHRQRLVGRLQHGLSAKLILLSASAGFGKTTLLSDWVAQCSCSVAWLSLDELDNDPTRFWSYVIGALQAHIPTAGVSTLSMLRMPNAPPLENILTTLINELATLTSEIILVLDDYHVIETQAIQQGILFLLEHLPLHLHLAISSRVDPPLPIARLRVRRQVAEIRDEDLRFSLEEALDFLRQCMGLQLAEDDVKLLEQRTEGWIAGLQLAALSLAGHSDPRAFIQAFTGSHRYVLDYLMDEVLQRQPANVQRFLEQTAVLKRISVALCETLVPQENCQEMLKYLERANLFLLPLDDERQWYRYHTLFRDVLLARLQSTQPGRVVELHLSAAQWYAAHDFASDAIYHALTAEDYDYSAALIERYADGIWMNGQLTLLTGWLRALPEAVLYAHLKLCLIYAWVIFLTTWDELCDRLIQHVERVLASGHDSDELQGMIAAIMASEAMMRGESSRVIPLSLRALLYLPPEQAMWRLIPAMNLGFGYQILGQTPAASLAFKEARLAALASNNRYYLIIITCGMASTLIFQARLSQAQQLYQEAQNIIASLGGQLPTAGYADIGLAEIFYQWNDLAQAHRYVLQGIANSRPWKAGDIAIYGNRHLAYILLAQGDSAGAWQALQTAEAVVQKISGELNNPEIMALRIRLQLAQGDLAAVNAWLEQQTLSTANLDYRSEIRLLMAARVLITQGKYVKALPILAEILAAAEKDQRPASCIDIQVVRAVAFEQAGELDLASHTVSAVLRLTEAAGYIRSYIDEGKPMQRLLARYRTEQVRQGTLGKVQMDYVQRLLAAFPVTAGAQSSNTSTVEHPVLLLEPLSERELAVLHLVASGASNQAIAKQLVITLSTVKKHVSSILSKLGVESRTQAISRARELLLL